MLKFFSFILAIGNLFVAVNYFLVYYGLERMPILNENRETVLYSVHVLLSILILMIVVNKKKTLDNSDEKSRGNKHFFIEHKSDFGTMKVEKKVLETLAYEVVATKKEVRNVIVSVKKENEKTVSFLVQATPQTDAGVSLKELTETSTEEIKQKVNEFAAIDVAHISFEYATK